MSKSFNFTTVEQFQAFVNELLILRDKIKCPVCLDPTKNPVRINCDHIFCGECLETFINTFKDQAPNKKPQCPICRKAINRQRKAVNGYVNAVIDFVEAASITIHSTFGCDISFLSNIDNTKEAWRKLNLNVNVDESNSQSSNIIQPTDNIVDEDVNIFDKLKNGMLKTVKKYSRRPKNKVCEENKASSSDKALTFESKETIGKWLEDTKNRFDRLTQTQEVLSEGVENESQFDMPSISQCNGSVSNKESKKRPRSLEVRIKTPIVKIKRHSFCGNSEEVKKVDIEDDSDEILQQKEAESEKKEQKGKGKRLKKDKINEENKKTGWGRIKNMNKTIKKNTKQTKMLPVSLTSATVKEKDFCVVNPVVFLNKLESEFEYNRQKKDRDSIVKGTAVRKDDVEAENDINQNQDFHNQQKSNKNTIVGNDIADKSEHENTPRTQNKNSESFTNKTCWKSSKLISGKIFSDDDEDDMMCSIQCSKVEHATCGTASKPKQSPDVNPTLVDDAALTIAELKEFLNTSNTQKVKSSITKLKLIVDRLSKTNCRSSSMCSLIKNSTTMASTKTIDYDVKSVCIQTDTILESGFKISSAEDFKTREFVCKDVQTEPFFCINCTGKNNSISKSPTDVLVDETRKPQNSERYEFTQSFDDMEFDTQEFVNSTVKKSECNTKEIQKQEKNCHKISLRSQGHLKLQEGHLDPQVKVNEKKQTSENISPKITLRSQGRNSKIDLEPIGNLVSLRSQQGQSQVKVIEKQTKENINNPSQIRSTLDGPRSCFEFSLSNQPKLNVSERERLKESVSDAIKKYKRIRSPDSDSESETNYKKKKLENKYLAENLSIEMLSEDVLDCQPSKTTGSISLDKCDDVDYDVYLTNILKKYDDNTNNDDTANKQKEVSTCKKASTSKKSESQNVMEICDAMIRNVETKKSDLVEIDHNTRTIHSNNNNKEDVDLPEIVRESPIDDFIHEEFNEPFETQPPAHSTAIIPTSGAFKLSTESFMANINIDNYPVTKINKSSVRDDLQNRDLDGTDRNVTVQENSKLKVLQNIIVAPARKLGRTLSVQSTKSVEIFDSDVDEALEEDVIETTPKTNRDVERRSFSQVKPKSLLNSLLPLPPLVDSPDVISSLDPVAFLDQTFAPPTEFQDFSNTGKHELPPNSPRQTTQTDDFDITMVPTYTATTPTKEIPNNPSRKKEEPELSLTESEMLQFMSSNDGKIITSTQRTHAEAIEPTLGISPIRAERRRQNPIEAAQQAKFSPLDVILTKSQSKVLTPLQTKQRSILSFVRQENRNDLLDDSVTSVGSTQLMPAPMKPVKPCISCTRLSKEQVLAISMLTTKRLATYSNSFVPNVTHMVVSVNENNCLLDHTMKYLMAVATGKWVVNFEWIRECMNKNKIVPEAPYEVLDVAGLPGPRDSRLLRKKKPLLLGYKIHIAPPFISAATEEVEQLITLMGGELIPDLDMMSNLSGLRVIVTEAKSTQDYFQYEQWLETYKVIVVDIEWLSRSIGQYKVLSFRPFALCTDENIECLGYPSELVEDNESMFVQSISTGRTAK